MDKSDTDNTRLESVIEQLPAGIVLAELPSGRIVLTNHELERILGHVLIDSPEVTDYAHWGAMHSDGRPYAAAEHPLARAVTQGETINNEEVYYRRPDGTVRVLSASATLVRDAAGEAQWAVASFVDISEQKLAEQAQRLLAEAGRRLVASLDVQETLERTVSFFIPALADLAVVYLREGDVVRRLSVAHTDPNVVARYRAISEDLPLSMQTKNPAIEVIRSGAPVALSFMTPEEVRKVALSQVHGDLLCELDVRHILWVPLQGRAQTIGALGFMMSGGSRNLSGLRTYAEELGRLAGLAIQNAQLYAEAQNDSRLREQFLAVVSHDLRNPLNVIEIAGQLLRSHPQEQADSAQLSRTAGLLQRAVERMRRLIDDLLDLESIRVGRLSIHPQPERISDVLHEAIATYQLLADQAAIQLTLELSQTVVDLYIPCDRARILQVLGNLLENAIKYTAPEQEVKVVCDVKDDGVEVAIVDSGPGISSDDRETIFQRFWRKDQRNPGVGLGLFIARGIVSAHHGHIEALPRQDASGSVLRFWLPQRPDSKTTPAATP